MITITNPVRNKYSILYLYYIRYKISKINNVDDIVKIFKIINYYFNYSCTTDMILDILINSLLLYPLTDIELQKLSLLQQQYYNYNNIFGYITLTLWLAVIHIIIINED